jgi:hypothetical protein
MSTITTEKAREVASTAVDEGKHIADVAMTQMSEKSQAQREHIAETLRGFSDSLEEMASRSDLPDRATDAAQLVADRTRGLSTRLDGGKPRRLRRLGRFVGNHRVAVLLGALGTGAVAVRLSRRSKPTMTSTSPSTSAPTSAPTTPSTVTPQGQHKAPMEDQADDAAWANSGKPPLP